MEIKHLLIDEDTRGKKSIVGLMELQVTYHGDSERYTTLFEGTAIQDDKHFWQIYPKHSFIKLDLEQTSSIRITKVFSIV